MRLRICTFNIENLFTRFDFGGFSDPRAARYLPPIVQFLGDFGDGDLSKFPEFKRAIETAAIAQDDDHRQHTALAFAAADADVYCLQEVDSIDALTRFMEAYVRKIGVDPYPNIILQEGNDPRGIDVAAITRDIRPSYARSHATYAVSDLRRSAVGRDLLATYPKAAEEARSGGRIFRRDCLELEVLVGDTRVTLFNCHFKSMGGGRDRSMGRRQLEACAVRAIAAAKFDDPATALWAVCGDLNDYRQVIRISKSAGQAETVKVLAADDPSGVDPLLDGFGTNLLEEIAPEDRWTHYYAGERHKTQLDYVIASPALAARLRGTPEIIRAGMPFRVPNLDVLRYPRVGWDRPKASDHCPVVVEFDI
ncbi:MAG: endonuclease/exonuclease/phosphatase family protein [Jannaschia sp.]